MRGAVIALAAAASLAGCKLSFDEHGRRCINDSSCADGWQCVKSSNVDEVCTDHQFCCVPMKSRGARCQSSADCEDGLLCATQLANAHCRDRGDFTDGPPSRELSCSDQRDDDQDGRIDCADANDCSGEICNVEAGLICIGSDCRCDDGSSEVCNDGIDNDCDGKVDCKDVATCEGKSCGLTESQCVGDICRCLLGDPPEQDCNDNKDNDCDGFIDCEDQDCRGRACDEAMPMFRCDAERNCAMGTGELVCNDGVDNDTDGLTDCEDPDCEDIDCSRNGKVGMKCLRDLSQPDAPVKCSCPWGTSATENACGDGKDNDCDGLVDCADVDDCPEGEVCVPNSDDPESSRICMGGACDCPVGSSPETNCRDDRDNDCNFYVDCDDPSCNGRPCHDDGFVCHIDGSCGPPRSE